MSVDADTSAYDKPFVLENMTDEAAIAFGIIIILGFAYCIQVVGLLRIGRVASAKVSELRRQRLSSLAVEDAVDMPLVSTLYRADSIPMEALLNPMVLSMQKMRMRAKTIIDHITSTTGSSGGTSSTNSTEDKERPPSPNGAAVASSPSTAATAAQQSGGSIKKKSADIRGSIVQNSLHLQPVQEVQEEEEEEDTSNKKVGEVAAAEENTDLLVLESEAEPFEDQIQRLRSMTTVSTDSNAAAAIATGGAGGGAAAAGGGGESGDVAINPLHALQSLEHEYEMEHPHAALELQEQREEEEEERRRQMLLLRGGENGGKGALDDQLAPSALERVNSGLASGDEEDKEFLQVLRRMSSEKGMEAEGERSSTPSPSALSSNRNSEVSLNSLSQAAGNPAAAPAPIPAPSTAPTSDPHIPVAASAPSSASAPAPAAVGVAVGAAHVAASHNSSTSRKKSKENSGASDKSPTRSQAQPKKQQLLQKQPPQRAGTGAVKYTAVPTTPSTSSAAAAVAAPASLASRKQSRQQAIIRGMRVIKAKASSSSSGTSSLVVLSLTGLGITDGIAKLIAAALRANDTITSLDLSSNSIELAGCVEIASALGRVSDATLVSAGLAPSNPRLKRSSGAGGSGGNLTKLLANSPRGGSHGGAGSMGAGHSFDHSSSSSSSGSGSGSALQAFNTTLRNLDLKRNAIGPKGAVALAEALRFNPALTSLDVSFQTKGKKIGPDGATAFATLLHLKHPDGRDVSALKVLRMARSNISFEGCRHLASALMSNSTLTDLDIGHINYIGISGSMQLGQAIACSTSTKLQWLTVGSHRLPVPALLGDQELYRSMQNVLKAKRNVDSLAAHAPPSFAAAAAAAASSPSFSASAGATAAAAAAAALDPKQRAAAARHRSRQAAATKALERAEEALLAHQHRLLMASEAHSLRCPPNLVVSVVDNEDYQLSATKAFMEMSSHGMDDELGVVVSTLLKRNRTLEHLTLVNCALPVQALAGYATNGAPPPRFLDLSSRGITNMDAIIIGSLVADNSVLRKINLRGNNFASTEGENFVAYALEKNRRLQLDLLRWPKERMYFDGYLSLASVQGMSASGAKIEPQRLEGWFYRSITAVAGMQYYVNMVFDIITINIFATNPDTYRQVYVDLASFLICVPTGLYCLNSLRNAWGTDMRAGLIDATLAVLQITPWLQAWECVVLACETTAYLDYKYVQGMYKQVPWIMLKAYIMLEVAVNKGLYDLLVLASLLASLLSIIMVFIMLYDRKEARRLSYLPVAIQPRLARVIANVLTCFGMGKDTSLVKQFVNFDSYYTAHYCVSYVYQFAGVGARALAIAWICATADAAYVPMILFMIFVVRVIVVCLHDPLTFKRTLYNNLVHVLSLCVTDSAWSTEVTDDTDPVTARACYVGLALLSTFENAAASLYAAFLHPRGTLMSHMTNGGLFSLCIICMCVRWLLLMHWAVVVHFPSLYSGALLEHHVKEARGSTHNPISAASAQADPASASASGDASRAKGKAKAKVGKPAIKK